MNGCHCVSSNYQWPQKLLIGFTYAMSFLSWSAHFHNLKYSIITSSTPRISGLGSVVNIVTDYELDGPGIKSRWRRDFLHLSRLALWPTQPPVQWVLGLSWG